MSPKDSKKVKPAKKEEPAALPSTPQKPKSQPKGDAKEAPKKTPQKTPKKKTGDEKLGEDDFHPLPIDTCGGTIPIEVKYEGDTVQARHYEKKHKNGKILKLWADDPFALINTVMLTEGPYAGHQAIIVRPAKALQFMKFPEEVRTRVYREYFANLGCHNDEIVLDGKRKETKEAYAKTYAEKFKHRVALLRVNKEVHKEAISVFYSQPLRFESTALVIDFIGLVSKDILPRLRSVAIVNYNKATARNAMHFLAEAKNLQKLHFEKGVFAEADPVKAAKAFYVDTYKFLNAIGQVKGDKAAGVDILDFAKGALTMKDSNSGAGIKNWDDAMVDEFKENLKKKLNAVQS